MKQCPCGKYPEKLDIFPSNTSKWAYVAGSCCNEWMIEFRTKYLPHDSPECMALAIAEWNATQRDERIDKDLEEA